MCDYSVFVEDAASLPQLASAVSTFMNLPLVRQDGDSEQVPTILEQKAVELARHIGEELSTHCMVVRGLQQAVFTC